jgi:hypothetical protein
MPLPADERLIALSEELLQQFDTIFGLHPGVRAAHAGGALLTGRLRRRLTPIISPAHLIPTREKHR